MFSKGLFVGLLAVSLLVQGLPISVCRCALAAAANAKVTKEVAAEPACPHCVAKADQASNRSGTALVREGEVAFDVPCCCRSSAFPCCQIKSRASTIVTTPASVPDRPAPHQALPPTDPFAVLSGVSIDGVTRDAVPEVPPRLPVRILLCVWRK